MLKCDPDAAAPASVPGRLLGLVRAGLLIVAALVASGCQFLQNEFYYLDRAQPAPLELNAGEHGSGGQ